jgi:hypothetical protein
LIRISTLLRHQVYNHRQGHIHRRRVLFKEEPKATWRRDWDKPSSEDLVVEIRSSDSI